MRTTGFLLRVTCSLLVAFALAGNVTAQKKDDEKAPPPTGIDAATGKILTEAIEALNNILETELAGVVAIRITP